MSRVPSPTGLSPKREAPLTDEWPYTTASSPCRAAQPRPRELVSLSIVPRHSIPLCALVREGPGQMVHVYYSDQAEEEPLLYSGKRPTGNIVGYRKRGASFETLKWRGSVTHTALRSI